MSRTEEEILASALLHLDYVERYAARDLTDEAIVDAIALRLAAMVDALTGLHSDVLDAMFGPTWKAMRGMRNRIAHGYQSVDAAVIRLTATEEMPRVRALIEARLS